MCQYTLNNHQSFCCHTSSTFLLVHLLRQEVPVNLRLRVVERYVCPILLYGAETWSLKVKSLNRIEAFEMWILRKLLKIPWVDHVSNEQVLQRAIQFFIFTATVMLFNSGSFSLLRVPIKTTFFFNT